MNTQVVIKNFVDFIIGDPDERPYLAKLLQELDRLAHSIYLPEFKFDNTEYPEPPESDYSEIRRIIEKKFPQLGFYCTVDSDIENLGTSSVSTGDAIDDLADIVGDLIDVTWHFENTSENNALWNLEFDYKSHWGLQLRELQRYLHKLYWHAD